MLVKKRIDSNNCILTVMWWNATKYSFEISRNLSRYFLNGKVIILLLYSLKHKYTADLFITPLNTSISWNDKKKSLYLVMVEPRKRYFNFLLVTHSINIIILTLLRYAWDLHSLSRLGVRTRCLNLATEDNFINFLTLTPQ